MSATFAKREATERSLDDIEIITGGTDPANAVYPAVLNTMQELDIDIADRAVRDWVLSEPKRGSSARVREMDTKVQAHVTALFDESGGR